MQFIFTHNQGRSIALLVYCDSLALFLMSRINFTSVLMNGRTWCVRLREISAPVMYKNPTIFNRQSIWLNEAIENIEDLKPSIDFSIKLNSRERDL